MWNWIKWKICNKELVELNRWRLQWGIYRQWLAMFPEIAIALDQLKNEVDGHSPMFIGDLRDKVIIARKSELPDMPCHRQDDYVDRTERQKLQDAPGYWIEKNN